MHTHTQTNSGAERERSSNSSAMISLPRSRPDKRSTLAAVPLPHPHAHDDGINKRTSTDRQVAIYQMELEEVAYSLPLLELTKHLWVLRQSQIPYNFSEFGWGFSHLLFWKSSFISLKTISTTDNPRQEQPRQNRGI